MTQTINVPGVGALQFPDGMSQPDMAAAIQKNYPQLNTPTTPKPDDSGFLSTIKGLGNEAARVGIKTITGLPLMAADAFTGAANLIRGKQQTQAGLIRGDAPQYPYELPSTTYDRQLDSSFAPPTTTGGKISEGLSTLIASLGLPGPAVPQAAKLSLTGADAVKAEAMSAARQAGVVVPPSLTKAPPTVANAANGWGGIAETLKGARNVNTPAINGLIAKDIGLDAGSSLTPGAVKGQIADAVQAGYAPLRSIGDIPVDAAHRVFVQTLAGTDRGASNISPTLGNPQIAALADALTPAGTKVNSLTNEQKTTSFDSGDLVDAISALRSKASDAYAAGNNTLGKAYKQAATGFESLIDRHLQGQGADGSAQLANFRLARTRIAKGNDALDALNPATGDIDPRVLAGMDDGQMTGGSKAAATIARAFPDAVVPAKGTMPSVTAFQANAAEAASNPYGVMASILGRPVARNYALSDKVQQSLMQPKGKTLSRAALDAVHANPAAFSALYGDKDLYGQQNK